MPLISRKYFFDTKDLQYKKVSIPFSRRLMRFLAGFALSLILFFAYKHAFNSVFGSPKAARITNQIESLKLDMMMLNRELDNKMAILNDLRVADDNRYRPVLGMDTLPGYYRQAAYGGIDRYRELTGYINSPVMLSLRTKMEDIKSLSRLQSESFEVVSERTTEWKRQMEYLPMISPVNVSFRLGEGIRFREVHPVHGNPQWHHGQDFRTPVGTQVYATGAGTVIAAGWNSGGFGNYVVIDHGYGFRTTYGHLSEVKVTAGAQVKRAQLIGLSGNTGISSGPHLHYQIDLFGKIQNPIHFFNDDLTEDEYFEMIKTLSTGVIYGAK
ncbi:MAG: M23 family metallopeptidase [Bacteroidales bacterium]|nr:M23 family metallopeptidase [Bacteroidales bacterium]